MAALTRRQKEVFDYIALFVSQNGYSPSLEEIGAALGMSSVATVHKHVAQLRRKGLIRHESNKKRSLEVESEDFSGGVVELPLLGFIAAGAPIEAVENRESIAVPSELVPKTPLRKFVLRVKGSSMIDDHIMDGDFVIVVEGQSPNNGQTVVALLDGENATLKKYYREKDAIRLQPANESMQPIIVKNRDVRVQGIVVGLMRRY
ncbi:MAG: transcriptional repressor LexA [Candidatus Abyssobacteria bacterium SURF_5]|uniref:LexA repressor n=1 Tax=Abyssobacteria bacterium (strain SURF_5) TaxID=2093360 RepID=A0A3A4NJ54_ABYX5|nr:MAG: transcriptional repressor LexA [Candidatus Abyssubacteria bacterium SURF_5]